MDIVKLIPTGKKKTNKNCFLLTWLMGGEKDEIEVNTIDPLQWLKSPQANHGNSQVCTGYICTTHSYQPIEGLPLTSVRALFWASMISINVCKYKMYNFWGLFKFGTMISWRNHLSCCWNLHYTIIFSSSPVCQYYIFKCYQSRYMLLILPVDCYGLIFVIFSDLEMYFFLETYKVLGVDFTKIVLGI